VEGNIRERVKVFGREATSLPWSCSQKVAVVFREKGDVLSLVFSHFFLTQN
jgi:hypothetical protein